MECCLCMRRSFLCWNEGWKEDDEKCEDEGALMVDGRRKDTD